MLKIAGIINIILGIGHLIAMIWLNEVFEIFGIGEPMNELSQIHPSIPYIITVIVAMGFFIFGLYGFSAAGMIRKLPLLKLGIFGIAALFILRAVSGIVEILFTDVSLTLETTNSIVSLTIGLLYLLGGLKKWSRQPSS